jgi:hypothetical protein
MLLNRFAHLPVAVLVRASADPAQLATPAHPVDLGEVEAGRSKVASESNVVHGPEANPVDRLRRYRVGGICGQLGQLMPLRLLTPHISGPAPSAEGA